MMFVCITNTIVVFQKVVCVVPVLSIALLVTTFLSSYKSSNLRNFIGDIPSSISDFNKINKLPFTFHPYLCKHRPAESNGRRDKRKKRERKGKKTERTKTD